VDTYVCACVAGYEGLDCATDSNECSPDLCQNGGTCSESSVDPNVAVDTYVCACVAGYEGLDCETDSNECSPDLCQNGGACSESGTDLNVAVDTYVCACVAGYEGLDCETDSNECSPDPCQNGGACSESGAAVGTQYTTMPHCAGIFVAISDPDECYAAANCMNPRGLLWRPERFQLVLPQSLVLLNLV
jgi:hypothetical protein